MGAKKMYYCEKNFLMDMEDLIYDFLTYRKNKFKNHELKKNAVKMSLANVQSLIENVDFDKLPEPIINKICFCEDNNNNNKNNNQLNKKLDDIIDQVLNNYEYDGSPIFDDNIDRETLAQIIQKVIDLAINQIDELKNINKNINPDEIKQQNFNTGLSSYDILKSLIEALIINNIFYKRKASRDDFNRFMPY